MFDIIGKIRGDKTIWAMVFLLAIVSFLPVYSASTNLVYVIGKGTTFGYLFKHLVHVLFGFAIIFFIHKLPYHYFKALSIFALPLVILLLVYTLFKGTMIGGANASRWIQIPFVGISFQTSTIAFIVLMTYVARYLSKVSDKEYSFADSLLELWAPVFIVLALVLPANFSTAALIFSMVCMLVFIGQYPLKYLGFIVGAGIVSLTMFILVAKAFPDSRFFSRVSTWESRIERFTSDKADEDNYQIEKAKTAIASGGLYGLGPGKSVQKNFLPQSSSDFIFAIIVEEWGLIGGLSVLGLYLLLMFRFVIASHKANTLFGKLIVIALGFPMIFQAMINMAVAVELLPVTGQTLPLISSGGSSIWMTCFALGVILSVTKKEEEIAQELKEKQIREEALQKLIDAQLESDAQEKEEEYSIEDLANPMNAVLNR